MRTLATTQFDQCVLNMALIHLCNSESEVGQEMRKGYHDRRDETDEPSSNPWLDLHQFTIYVPHPDQHYEGVSLGASLNKGYNIEVQPVLDRSRIPYIIPTGAQFVVVFKQKQLNGDFGIAATGLFVRPLAVLKLDIIVDMQKPEYQTIAVKHPILRDYPTGWEHKLQLFINQELRSEDLPNLVGHVDQALNPDYRSPSWDEVHLAAKGFAGV